MNAEGKAASASPSRPAHAQSRGGRVPDFFVVGQPKAGTTALHDMLRQHPQVYLPERKEPWFMAEELLERPPPRPGGTPATLAEYEAWFAGAGAEQRVGEVSPMYLWSRTAAERIAAVQPQAKIVAFLREPGSFLQSLHRQFVEVYVENENDLRRALALEQERREGRHLSRHTYWPKALLYSDHVRYVEQLRRYEERFGRERMLVLTYDDFRADNAATIRRLLRFVEVDPDHPIERRESNLTVHVRSQRLNELTHALIGGRGPLMRAAKAGARALTPRALRRAAVDATRRHLVYGQAPPADDALLAELRARYREEVEALSAYLDRDLLTLWGYADG